MATEANTNTYYQLACRTAFLGVSTGDTHRHYLHGDPKKAHEATYLTEKDPKKRLEAQNLSHEFAVQLYDTWFSKIPVFKKCINKKNNELFVELKGPQRNHFTQAHYFLGFVKHHKSILAFIRKMPNEWCIEEFCIAAVISHRGDLMPNLWHKTAMLLKLCAIASGTISNSTLTTDGFPYRSITIEIPEDIHLFFYDGDTNMLLGKLDAYGNDKNWADGKASKLNLPPMNYKIVGSWFDGK